LKPDFGRFFKRSKIILEGFALGGQPTLKECQGYTRTQCYIYKAIPVTTQNNIKNHGI
jgi:hypothetical protein